MKVGVGVPGAESVKSHRQIAPSKRTSACSSEHGEGCTGEPAAGRAVLEEWCSHVPMEPAVTLSFSQGYSVLLSG